MKFLQIKVEIEILRETDNEELKVLDETLIDEQYGGWWWQAKISTSRTEKELQSDVHYETKQSALECAKEEIKQYLEEHV